MERETMRRVFGLDRLYNRVCGKGHSEKETVDGMSPEIRAGCLINLLEEEGGYDP